MPKRWGWRRAGWILVVLALFAVDAQAHKARKPHHFILQQVHDEGDSLVVTVWVERPTPAVVVDFEAMFRDEPRKASEQDEVFRNSQWRRIADALHLSVDGTEIPDAFRPAALPNNGKGNDDFFVYVLRAVVVAPEAGELSIRLVDTAFEGEHVFISNYLDLSDRWKVLDNSAASVEGVRSDHGPGRADATWSHDPTLRDWTVRLRAPSGRY